jgi:hypothetical protein
MRRGCKKLAQKLTCMDTPWEPDEYDPRSSEPPTGETSTVRTPPASGVRTDPANEDDVEYTEEEEDYAPGFSIHHHERDEQPYFDHQWDELGLSQLGGAPLPTQGDDQVLSWNTCLLRTL